VFQEKIDKHQGEYQVGRAHCQPKEKKNKNWVVKSIGTKSQQPRNQMA